MPSRSSNQHHNAVYGNGASASQAMHELVSRQEIQRVLSDTGMQQHEKYNNIKDNKYFELDDMRKLISSTLSRSVDMQNEYGRMQQGAYAIIKDNPNLTSADLHKMIRFDGLIRFQRQKDIYDHYRRLWLQEALASYNAIKDNPDIKSSDIVAIRESNKPIINLEERYHNGGKSFFYNQRTDALQNKGSEIAREKGIPSDVSLLVGEHYEEMADMYNHFAKLCSAEGLKEYDRIKDKEGLQAIDLWRIFSKYFRSSSNTPQYIIDHFKSLMRLKRMTS